ncbi:hypothetical protein EON67_00325 [archaeon]|nr:MAG: hypothetical protein EON67_00325 [archaeon]
MSVDGRVLPPSPPPPPPPPRRTAMKCTPVHPISLCAASSHDSESTQLAQRTWCVHAYTSLRLCRAMRSRLSVALTLAAATCCALPRAASAARPVHVRGGGGNSRARDAARGTYTNPVIPGVNTPDPGVVWDAASNLWYAVATSGDRQNAFPIFSSPDLGTWTQRGYIFPGDSAPAWAGTNFWAPELHLVNGMWTAYFAATNTTSGKLSVGVAKSMSGTPVGPYKGAAVPLVSNSTMGMIGTLCVWLRADGHTRVATHGWSRTGGHARTSTSCTCARMQIPPPFKTMTGSGTSFGRRMAMQWGCPHPSTSRPCLRTACHSPARGRSCW